MIITSHPFANKHTHWHPCLKEAIVLIFHMTLNILRKTISVMHCLNFSNLY